MGNLTSRQRAEEEAESSSSRVAAAASSATTSASGKDTTGSEAEMDGASALAALATGAVGSDETANAGMGTIRHTNVFY